MPYGFIKAFNFKIFFYIPRNEVVGGYTGFTMSVHPFVCLSVHPSVDKSYVVR